MCVIASLIAYGALPVSDEVAVKGGFLVNFAKFVEWPDTTNSLGFCVIGDDRMAAYLEAAVAGKSVGSRSLTVKNRPDQEQMNACSVIYIGRAGKNVASEVAQSVMGKHILTVSEFPELGSRGVTISFFIDEERVRFEVHLGAVSQAGLKISSKLLALARIAGERK
jgi:YfiR/HmsC-like